MNWHAILSRPTMGTSAIRLYAIIIGLAATPIAFAAIAADSPRPSNAEILFRLANPCPSTGQAQGICKGYVIDRVIPIVCGGAEEPGNMQWQTLAKAKEKDRWERIGCRAGRKLVLPQESTVVTEAFSMDVPEPITEVTALPIE